MWGRLFEFEESWEGHSCLAAFSKPVNSFCLTPPPPSSSARPLLRVLQGKINIFRNLHPRLLSLLFLFPFYLNPGKLVLTSPFLTAQAIDLASYCHPQKKKKSAPRGKVVIATAFTTATPKSIHPSYM